MKRDTSLDYLRGLAIISIVIGHLYFFSGRADGSIVWNICNTIQIPIFIFVSGLLAQKSINKYSFVDFFYSRSIRLLVPFQSFFIIWVILNGITFDNIIMFVTDEFKQGFWFLIVLFELMAIVSTNRFLAKQWRKNYLILDIISLILLNIYHFFITEFSIIDKIFSINLLWHYYPIFILGIHSDRIQFIFQKRLAILYIGIYCGAFYFMYFQNIHAMTALCNISSLLFFYSFFVHGYRPVEHFIAKAGVNSLQIYLLHILFLGIFPSIIPIIENRWLEFGVFLIIAIIMCFLFILLSKLLTKMPFCGLLLFGIRQ